MTKPSDTDYPFGTCAFCQEQARLLESHIIPAFVFKWLRSRSGPGHMRSTNNINRRVQDGLKLPWLCAPCEQRFSRVETAFATKVFHPWHAGEQRIFYEDWLLKFCVSVSWRVLRYARGLNKDTVYTPEQHRLMTEAELRWRQFLNEELPHPGPFEQHLLILDNIGESSIPDLPTNINRFLTGAVTFDIVGSERSVMTFAKLGRFTIFGIIQEGPNRWVGTKVHVKRGLLQPGDFTIPAGILDLIRQKAELAKNALDDLTSTQRDKIEDHLRRNMDAFSRSDLFKSIDADVRMFGPKALRKD